MFASERYGGCGMDAVTRYHDISDKLIDAIGDLQSRLPDCLPEHAGMEGCVLGLRHLTVDGLERLWSDVLVWQRAGEGDLMIARRLMKCLNVR